MAFETRNSGVVRFATFQVDLRSGELRKQGVKIKVQEQPFRVLTVLLQRPGEVVTREELRNQNWSPDTFVDFENSLNTAINKLRDALGDSADNPRFIETLPRRGYRFIAPVSSDQQEKSPVPAEESKVGDEQPGKNPRTRRWLVLAAVAVLALLTLAYVTIRRRTKDAVHSKINSLAVLPLKNLSGDPTQEYLADGMTESLIGRLSTIRGLRVISRTLVMVFRDTRISAPEIAKALNVDAIVEGSVIRKGSRVRVHAQLIRAATDEHFWSETYDRELRDVLALESDAAQSIARKVEITVTGEEHARLTAARSVSPEVYESYLKGRFNKHNSKAEVEQSIAYFEDAIKRDPTFAPAYVGLADAYDRLGTVFVGAPPTEARQKQMSAARKALDLDPTIAEAHVLLADVLQRRWQWVDAEAEYRRALDLNPSDSAAHIGFAMW